MFAKVMRVVISTILAIAIVFFAAISYVRTSSDKYIYSSIDALPHAQAVMILGAGIKANGEVSSVLKDRMLNALAIYKAKKADKIIISGNNTKVVTLSDDEVTPVRLYLLAQGVPASDIFTDYEGFDTYTSMYHAKYEFSISSLIISTQQFHLARSVYLARSFGIQASGLPADVGTYQDKNYLREYLAQPKAVFEVLSQRSIDPSAKTYPITGNGQDSWK